MIFVQQKHLAAIEVTAYNPTKDADGSGAKLVVDLLAGILENRLESLKVAVAVASAPEQAAANAAAVQSYSPVSSEAPSGPSSSAAAPATLAEPEIPAVAPAEAWSSESLQEEPEEESSAAQTAPEGTSDDGEGSKS